MKFNLKKLKKFKLLKILIPLASGAIMLLTLPILHAGPYIPSAGSILQQIKPSMPVVPSSAETGLVIDSGEAGTSSQSKQPCSSDQNGQLNSNNENKDNSQEPRGNLPPCH